jgi:general secretion pathway protein G
MKHSAFTIIELVFVLVVLGILAAVALPKLAATRDDAKLTVTAHNVMVAAEDIATYAVSRGHTTPLLSTMSYAIKRMVEDGNAVDTGHYEAQLGVASEQDCIRLKIENPGAATEILKLINGSGSGELCTRLRGLIDPASFPIPLRGHRISI